MDENRQIDIMGIVNLTDDSFFQDSRCQSANKALERIASFLEQGASIIDLGACSTRPGSEPVGAEEEWRRLEPVLRLLKNEFPNIHLSVDTYWSAVVERTYDLMGPFMVNDISSGEDDPLMLQIVGRLGLQYVAMHKRGTPGNMSELTDYDDVTEDVLGYFNEFSSKAGSHGIKDWILDPGFGFAKTLDQNYELLRNLDKFKASGRRILVGLSRKSMIYRKFNISPEDSLPSTQVLHLKALQNGADILRVHDVAEAARTVSLYRILS